MNEIEAKFVIRRPEQIDTALRVLSANGFRVSEHGASTHVDQYFDTQDWSILAAGWACRVRHRKGNDKLTLKSLYGGDGNVFVRAEISQPAKAHRKTARLYPGAGPVKEELDAILKDTPAEELFHVTSRRTVYELEKPEAGPVLIELDLDESRIEADKTTDKASGVLDFTELELELKAGSAADLESAAMLLQDEAGLTPAQYSKFERGLQAAGLEIDTLIASPQATTIDEDDPVLTLLYAYLAEQLAIIRRQHPRALEGIDPEGVHQMRVAMRRTRAVMRAFRSILGDDVVSHFNKELRWLARNLGRARDADVTEQGAREADEADTGHYERFLEQETISAYEHLVEVLQSERCAALEEQLAQFVSAGPSEEMQDQHGNLSIADCARLFVHASLNVLLAHGDAIDADSPAKQLHKLRIETKRFRYLLDFFSTVQADTWAQAMESVKQLQDVLGEHQDAVTAQAQLADYAASITLKDKNREKLLATGRLMQKEEDRIAASRQRFTTTWSDFKDVMA
jgi:CHAD domain-containing protein/adenylate cyclase class IV